MNLLNIKEKLEGSEAKGQIGVKNPPTPSDRMFVGMRGMMSSLYGNCNRYAQTNDRHREKGIQETGRRFSDSGGTVRVI